MENYEIVWIQKIIKVLQKEGYKIKGLNTLQNKLDVSTDNLIEKGKSYLISTYPGPEITWFSQCYLGDVKKVIIDVLNDSLNSSNKNIVLNVLNASIMLGIKLSEESIGKINILVKDDNSSLSTSIKEKIRFLSDDSIIKKEIDNFLTINNSPSMAHKYFRLLNINDGSLKKKIRDVLISKITKIEGYYGYLEICLDDIFFFDNNVVEKIREECIKADIVSLQIYCSYLMNDQQSLIKHIGRLNEEFN